MALLYSAQEHSNNLDSAAFCNNNLPLNPYLQCPIVTVSWFGWPIMDVPRRPIPNQRTSTSVFNTTATRPRQPRRETIEALQLRLI